MRRNKRLAGLVFTTEEDVHSLLFGDEPEKPNIEVAPETVAPEVPKVSETVTEAAEILEEKPVAEEVAEEDYLNRAERICSVARVRVNEAVKWLDKADAEIRAKILSGLKNENDPYKTVYNRIRKLLVAFGEKYRETPFEEKAERFHELIVNLLGEELAAKYHLFDYYHSAYFSSSVLRDTSIPKTHRGSTAILFALADGVLKENDSGGGKKKEGVQTIFYSHANPPSKSWLYGREFWFKSNSSIRYSSLESLLTSDLVVGVILRAIKPKLGTYMEMYTESMAHPDEGHKPELSFSRDLYQNCRGRLEHEIGNFGFSTYYGRFCEAFMGCVMSGDTLPLAQYFGESYSMNTCNIARDLFWAAVQDGYVADEYYRTKGAVAIRNIDSDRAHSYETKKNIPKKVLLRMKNSILNKRFGYVEFDEDCDVKERIGDVEKQIIAFLNKYFPLLDLSSIQIRVRYIGQHKASGLYYPSLGCLIISIRDVSSFVHELGHCIDSLGGTLSEQPEFREIYRLSCACIDREIEKGGIKLSGKFNEEYLKSPTEVFARSMEMFFQRRIHADICSEYKEKAFAYPDNEKLMGLINTYFSDLLRRYGYKEEPVKKVGVCQSVGRFGTQVRFYDTFEAIRRIAA